MNNNSIVVLGSFMMDLVVRASRAPEAGETLIGRSFSRFPGGKGANQAVAASRLGGRVTMVGKLGQDVFGSDMLAVMEKEGIDAQHILFDAEHPTGVGSIVVDDAGENRIIVVPGANLLYSIEDLRKVESVIQQASMLVLQLEMDLSMTEQAAFLASQHGIPVILNPAPARSLSDELLSSVSYLTPNETEAAILSGLPVVTIEDAGTAGRILLGRGVRDAVIITLAAKGALIVTRDSVTHVEGFPVRPVDTVAAGDSFNGALAVKLSQGASLTEAVRFANAVGAIAVTREGAIPSLPPLEEVEQFMQNAGKTGEEAS